MLVSLTAAPITMAADPIHLHFLELVSAGAQVETREVRITATVDSTRIDHPQRTLDIDYRNLEVRRGTVSAGSIRYPLRASEAAPDTSVPGKMADLLAAFRVVAGDETRMVGPWRTKLKTIWFGHGLSRARTMAPLHQEQYGERFGERRLRCWVAATDDDRLAALTRISHERALLVRTNPLLLQLDPINLIEILGGMPVRMEEIREGQEHILELQTIR